MYTCKRLLFFFLFTFFISNLVGCQDGRIWGFNDDSDSFSALGGNTGLGSVVGKVTASGTITLSRLSPEIRTQIASGAVPILNAIVWIQDYPSITATTDQDGNYTLKNVPLGSKHRIVAKIIIGSGASKRTYKVRSSEVTIDSVTTLKVEVNLDLEVANNTVSGILRDKDGRPMVNTELSVWGEPFTTDSTGRFESPGLPDGNEVEVIEVKTPNGQTTPVTVVYGPPGTSFVDLSVPDTNDPNKSPRIILLRETPTTNIAPGETTSLWAVYFDPDGEVSDFSAFDWSVSSGILASSSQSLPTSLQEEADLFTRGISKSRIGIQSVTYTAPNSDGYYSISLGCTDKGGLSALSSIRVPVANPLSPPPTIPANRAPAPVISALTNVAGGTSLELSVSANDPDGKFGLSYQWSVSPSKGTFSNSGAQKTLWIAPTDAGKYTISCIVSDGKLEGTATHEVTVVSETPVTAPGKITGYVRDVDTQQPIANALVVISGTDLFTVSDTNGKFVFTGIKGGTYTLIASRNGYQIKTFTGIIVPAS